MSRAALLCNATAKDHEAAKSEVFFAAVPLRLEGKAENWSFDDAHAALLWAIERWNYVSTDMILERVFRDFFEPTELDSASGQAALIERVQNEWGALAQHVAKVTSLCGGEIDDDHDATSALNYTARTMGYKDHWSLCVGAPISAIRDMILWTMKESRFSRLYGRRISTDGNRIVSEQRL